MAESNEILIAVMGATGSGKSSFINAVSGSQLVVGDDLTSCTADVALSKPFELFGLPITFIDTPGFDDTTRSETDVLKTIALYLSTSYEQGYKLSGIVYLHRISDNRITGTARRNFNMFRKLCGDSTLHNVVIVTNMWGKVTPELGASRELELATDDRLFKPALSQGARMLRHNNTISSAHAILLSLLSNRPKALRIQEELVDERKDIADTDAGQELGRELAELAIQYRAQLDQVQKDLEEALRTKDIQTEKELEQIRKDLEGQINQLEHDRERISNDYAEKKRKTDEKMHEILESLKEEQGRRAQREQEISRLMRSADASAEDRARYTQELCELDEDTGPGIFSVIGKVLDDVLGIAAAFVAAGSMTMI